MSLTQWTNEPNLQWVNTPNTQWANIITTIVFKIKAFFIANEKARAFVSNIRTYLFESKTKP